MFRRKGIIDTALLAFTLLAFSSAAFSAELGKRGKKEYMGACSEADSGILYTITNPSGATCDPSQVAGSSNPVYCTCSPDGEGGYEWVTLQSAMGGGGDVDLSGYALLAGDADGQTIQGLTGNNKARIELSVGGDVGKAALIGGGATYGFIYAYADGVYGESPDELTSFDLYNGGLDLKTNGTAQFYGSTGTNLGSEGGWTTVIGTRVNITSLQTPPTNSNDTCTAGDTIDTATYHYYCAATDTWVRVAMATWP